MKHARSLRIHANAPGLLRPLLRAAALHPRRCSAALLAADPRRHPSSTLLPRSPHRAAAPLAAPRCHLMWDGRLRPAFAALPRVVGEGRLRPARRAAASRGRGGEARRHAAGEGGAGLRPLAPPGGRGGRWGSGCRGRGGECPRGERGGEGRRGREDKGGREMTGGDEQQGEREKEM